MLGQLQTKDNTAYRTTRGHHILLYQKIAVTFERRQGSVVFFVFGQT